LAGVVDLMILLHYCTLISLVLCYNCVRQNDLHRTKVLVFILI